MGKIHILAPEVISKIAAGEVIERPMYVVKELLDNSIDAGASIIEIQVENGGSRKIVVADNGEGMDQEDLKLSFQSHTTSKITLETDLTGISTLGFSGEALSSLASVSNILIQSRVKDSPSGTMVEVHGGKLVDSGPVGKAPGTKVEVTSLFFNVPARKIFLKSEATEYRNILNIVSAYCLSFPEIHFRLENNGKVVLNLPPTSDILERITVLLGKTWAESLIPVDFQDAYVHLTGFVLHPQQASVKQAQWLFVNRRKVSDRAVSAAVREAYGNLVPQTAQVVGYLLFLTAPKEVVDVNVHPKKEMVSFADGRLVFDNVRQAVLESLNSHNLTFANLSWKRPSLRSTETAAGQILKGAVAAWQVEKTARKYDFSKIVQIDNLYILVSTDRGFILIDEHAAHERILFEQYKKAFQKAKTRDSSWVLPEVLVLDLSLEESELLKGNLKTFRNLGFIIKEFPEGIFSLSCVPEIFKDHDLRKLFTEMFLSIRESGTVGKLDSFSEIIINYLSCRGAIKAGDALTQKQMIALIKKLEKTPNNYTCPHGRPTKIEVTVDELNKLFKRT